MFHRRVKKYRDKEDGERERERKMSSKGFSAGAVCWGMLLCPNTRSIPTELTLFLSLFSIVQD